MQMSSNPLFRPDRQDRDLLLLTLCREARPAIARKDETKPDLRATVPKFETLRPPNPKLPHKNYPAKKTKRPSCQSISARKNSCKISDGLDRVRLQTTGKGAAMVIIAGHGTRTTR